MAQHRGRPNFGSARWCATASTRSAASSSTSTLCSTTPRNGGSSIPADVRPRKDQPFYHLLAENAETEYIAYVSEQNLLPDASGTPLRHPQIGEMFTVREDGSYRPLFLQQPH